MIFMTIAIMNGHHHAALILQYGILVSEFILREIFKMALEREAVVQTPSLIHHTSLVRSMRVDGIFDPTITQYLSCTGPHFENLQRGK